MYLTIAKRKNYCQKMPYFHQKYSHHHRVQVFQELKLKILKYEGICLSTNLILSRENKTTTTLISINIFLKRNWMAICGSTYWKILPLSPYPCSQPQHTHPFLIIKTWVSLRFFKEKTVPLKWRNLVDMILSKWSN